MVELNAVPRGIIMDQPAALVVEDEPAVREMVAGLLRAEGYTVLEAPDGQEAIHTIDEQQVRLGVVLLDMRLPDVNGLMVLDHLKEQGADVPVVAVTGAPDAGSAALAAGAQAALPKPFCLNELLTVVAHFCSPQS